MKPLFHDRFDGGRRLAALLAEYANREDVVVLALPRGGVPVGFEVARALAAPLDVFLVRKLGLPGYEELAMGAIASGGIRVLNREVVRQFRVKDEAIETSSRHELEELSRREALYRESRKFVDVAQHLVILVDDGLATGSTMRAAAVALKQFRPASIVIAVPVGAADTCQSLEDCADLVICAETPKPFSAVGRWYANFTQTSDEEVRDLLARAAQELEIEQTRRQRERVAMEQHG